MGTTLDHGIYLPDEGERNCYEGLAGNWVALDNHLGSTNIHVTINDKQAWNGHIADSVKHVTAEDKQAWNGKADASALTAHTGDTTIHVTAADKAKWDAVTSKADDSDVVHKSGDETCTGNKGFVDNIIAKKIISNVAQLQINARSNADSVAVIAGDNASEGGGLWLYGKNSGIGSDCRLQIYNTSQSRYERVDLINSQFLPSPSGEIDCGGTSNKWKSINGINPGALSLPDFSNAIDISGYITVTSGSTTNNLYTPSADGYISVNLSRSSGAIGLVISNGKIEACVRENTFPDNHRECGGFIPVQKNDNVVITSCLADSIIWAYFIPCQGNV